MTLYDCDYTIGIYIYVTYFICHWTIPVFYSWAMHRRLEHRGISVSIVSAAQRRQAERAERAATLAGMQTSAQGRVPWKRSPTSELIKKGDIYLILVVVGPGRAW